MQFPVIIEFLYKYSAIDTNRFLDINLSIFIMSSILVYESMAIITQTSYRNHKIACLFILTITINGNMLYAYRFTK